MYNPRELSKPVYTGNLYRIESVYGRQDATIYGCSTEYGSYTMLGAMDRTGMIFKFIEIPLEIEFKTLRTFVKYICKDNSQLEHGNINVYICKSCKNSYNTDNILSLLYTFNRVMNQLFTRVYFSTIHEEDVINPNENTIVCQYEVPIINGKYALKM